MTKPILSNLHTDPQSYPAGVAFMDGQYLPMDKAKVSVLDYGFLHSDATYDVVHVWDGAFFRLDDHLDRFSAGLDKLHMSVPYDRSEIKAILHNCVSLSGLRDAYVEIICTRGTSPTFSRDPRDAQNNLIAFAIPFGSIANADQMERGLHAAITDVMRIPPASIDPKIKNYHWLDLVQGLYQAYDKGSETAILLDYNGNIAEGPGFNIFAVMDGAVHTPQHGVLMGVTRQTIFDVCARLQIECSTSDISPAVLCAADEVFVTSTAGGVMPVSKIDNADIGTGSVGQMTLQIKDAYWALHKDVKHRSVVDYPKI
jgi:branched-chain amino acid aminotransferase